MISDDDLTVLLKENIRQALADYRSHTTQVAVLDDVSEIFIDRLARDAVVAKSTLREMLRKSPAWNEKLQAVIINGTRNNDPDYARVDNLACKIFAPWVSHQAPDTVFLIRDAIRFFSNPAVGLELKKRYISAINQLAPKAYKPNRKRSRIFRNICDVLGVSDDTAGSDFQKLFAQLADELSSEKLKFKLFLSIDPAHFITMSNPKNDIRGDMLTSCHSFNSTKYEYNCGCSGYARDKVTMIAFTVDNPDDLELLNNRKTTRQLFMYEPDNGLLLQSRMYNSKGGVCGTALLSPLYRDLVQREISKIEGVPNLWKTSTYCRDRPVGADAISDAGFGGYEDWKYGDFDAKISIREDHLNDFKPLIIGTYGLCICCGKEIKRGLYCKSCNAHPDTFTCSCCGDVFAEDEMYDAFDCDGNEVRICEYCRDNEYRFCEHCEQYYPAESAYCMACGDAICRYCYEDNCDTCADCGEIYWKDEMYLAYDYAGNAIKVCEDCFDRDFVCCAGCGRSFHRDNVKVVIDSDGSERSLCDSCLGGKYEHCGDCGLFYHNALLENGLCSNCKKKDKV